MKRDMDLVRDILLAVEASDVGMLRPVDLDLADRSKDEVSYHVWLMADAGLLSALDFTTMARASWKPRQLTWAGHELLDSVRDPEIWRRTKQGVQKAGGFGLDVLAGLAKGLLRQKIKEFTGIDPGP